MRGRRDGQGDEAGADRRDGRDLARPHALVEQPRSHHEQEHKTHGEDRLHHCEGRDEQRCGLEYPPSGHEQSAEQPAALNGETGEQRGSQRAGGRRLPGLERLEGDPAVVERRGEYRADDPEQEEGHR